MEKLSYHKRMGVCGWASNMILICFELTVSEASRAAGAQRVTVNVTDCRFYALSGVEAALRSAVNVRFEYTQRAIAPEFCGNWGMEYLNTTLPCVGYSMKLKRI